MAFIPVSDERSHKVRGGMMAGMGADVGGAEAVLLTGLFGSGKSTVAMEIADLLERRSLTYALLDLDYLVWCSLGGPSEGTVSALLLENLAALLENYRRAGITRFVLAHSVECGSRAKTVPAGIGGQIFVTHRGRRAHERSRTA
jgi:hypothetical protein